MSNFAIIYPCHIFNDVSPESYQLRSHQAVVSIQKNLLSSIEISKTYPNQHYNKTLGYVWLVLPSADISMMTSSKWKYFPCHFPFMRGIHRSTGKSPHKSQWRGTLMFSLISAQINGWVNSRQAGDLRRHRAYYDVTVLSALPFIDGLVQDCSTSIANAPEILQSCIKPSTWCLVLCHYIDVTAVSACLMPLRSGAWSS